MTDFQMLSWILVLSIIVDAVGDAFRKNGNQIPHHFFEATNVAIWIGVIVIVARGDIQWFNRLIVMYITARIAIFDITFNIIAGNKWSYVGKSSLYGRLLTWFTSLPSIREPGFLIWVIRAMAAIWWIAWFITSGGFR